MSREIEPAIDRPASLLAVLGEKTRAKFRLAWGPAQIEAEVEVTPATLLAIGGMVGAILLTVVPIVSAGGRGKRR